MRQPSSYQRGFTLIEVTLGLTILILIFGVIFQLVQFSVMGANAAAQASLRSREVSGLFALVRQLCLDLPVNSQLAIENRGGRKGYELVVTNAPVAIFPEQYDGVRILGFELRKAKTGDGKELWLVESFTKTNTQSTEKPEVNEFRLMEDVKGLKWEAGDSRNQEKMNRPDWNEPVKPAFLRLTLERQTGKKTFTNTALFWIPAGMSPTGQAPVDPVTRSLMTTTNSTNPTVSAPTQ
jgi:type II secretory pathway pseudopilin PulG